MLFGGKLGKQEFELSINLPNGGCLGEQSVISIKYLIDKTQKFKFMWEE